MATQPAGCTCPTQDVAQLARLGAEGKLPPCPIHNPRDLEPHEPADDGLADKLHRAAHRGHAREGIGHRGAPPTADPVPPVPLNDDAQLRAIIGRAFGAPIGTTTQL